MATRLYLQSGEAGQGQGQGRARFYFFFRAVSYVNQPINMNQAIIAAMRRNWKYCCGLYSMNISYSPDFSMYQLLAYPWACRWKSSLILDFCVLFHNFLMIEALGSLFTGV